MKKFFTLVSLVLAILAATPAKSQVIWNPEDPQGSFRRYKRQIRTALRRSERGGRNFGRYGRGDLVYGGLGALGDIYAEREETRRTEIEADAEIRIAEIEARRERAERREEEEREEERPPEERSTDMRRSVKAGECITLVNLTQGYRLYVQVDNKEVAVSPGKERDYCAESKITDVGASIRLETREGLHLRLEDHPINFRLAKRKGESLRVIYEEE